MKPQALTIPKELASQGDLVLIPRKEYEALQEHLHGASEPHGMAEFIPTAAEKRDLAKAREDYKKGNYVSLEQFRKEMAGRPASRRS